MKCATIVLVALTVGGVILAMPVDDTFNETGLRLASFNESDEVNPEEMGQYLEGDIVSSPIRNGLIAERSHWDEGVVPYEIHGAFSTAELNKISDAMDAYHQETCIRFKPKIASDTDYISITSENSGCWSNVGKTGGKQRVNLQRPACLMKIGTVIHELMHAVGFMHEQNRFERDDFVDIIWKNIKPTTYVNFNKASEKEVSGFKVDYDYESVMHYSSKAFTLGGDTIIPKTTKKVNMGQREYFSKGDITKIRNMYDCKFRDEA